MSARTRRIARSGGIALLAAGLAGALVVPSATAATKKPPAPLVSVGNGAVGIGQTVFVLAPGGAGSTVAVQLSRGGVGTAQQPVSLNAQGAGGFTWTPLAAGTWTISGVAGQAPVSVTVAPIPTRTALFAPNQLQVGTRTVLQATVTATGTYLPVGTVTFTNADTGQVLGTADVGGTSTGTASGRISWQPTSAGGYRITATYAAADGSAVGSSSTNTSSVLNDPQLVSLLVPPTFTYGVPVTVSTRINNPQLTGAAAVSVNVNGSISTPAQVSTVADQEASVTWTPTVLGNQLLTSAFSSTNTSQTGTNVQWVYVSPAPGRDPMSVLVGGLGPLSTGSPISVAGGSRLAVTGSSGSGAPVTFVTSGPCYLIGGTLTTPASGGTCGLVASSAGAGDFGPNSAGFTITVTRTTKR